MFYLLAILLKSLKSDPKHIVQWLFECNIEKLSESVLEQLDKNLPEDTTIRKYADLKCPIEDLDICEKFLVDLSKIRGLRKRLHCLLFKHKFPDQHEELRIVNFTVMILQKNRKEIKFFNFLRIWQLVDKHVKIYKKVINLNGY